MQASNALALPRGGRPRGSGASFVRVQLAPRPVVYIGKRLWYDLGQPRRVQIRRNRPHDPTTIYLLPCTEPLGYAIHASIMVMPRITIGRARVLELGLVPGRFAGVVTSGVCQFDLAVPWLPTSPQPLPPVAPE